MPDPELLFGPTPHQEAIDFIRSKPAVSRDVFNGLLPELKARAFTITGVEGASVLQRVRDRIAELPAGHRWDDIKKDIVGDISPFIVDPDAPPQERDGQINAANRRAELLLRTHGFQAYQAASYDVMDRQRDVLPYWQYLTMEDDRVRDEHAALDQIVLPADSPFWQGHYPPWDFGCRCQVVAISQEDRDDVQHQDRKKAPDCQRVIDGPQAVQIVHGRIARAGRTYDVRTPREKKGNDAFGWHPGDLRLSIDQLRGRYDAATFADFEAWARRMPLEQGAAKTVWAWLGGAPAGVVQPLPTLVSQVAGIAALPAPSNGRRPMGWMGSYQVTDVAEIRSAGIIDTAGPAGAPMTPSRWNKLIGVDPKKFYEQLTAGLDLAAGTRIRMAADRNDPNSFSARVEGHLSTGESIHVFRKFNLTAQSVEHAYFEIQDTARARGLGKKVLSNFLGLYDHLGIQSIQLNANIDVGGYAWARYGFVPKSAAEWGGLRHEINLRWIRTKALYSFPAELVRQVEDALASDDPRSVWTIADLATPVGPTGHLGKRLLLDTDWLGTLDLNDAEQYLRFTTYLRH